MLIALEMGEVETLTPIKLRYTGKVIDLVKAFDNQNLLQTQPIEFSKQYMDTTVGRVILKDALPEDMPFINDLLKLMVSRSGSDLFALPRFTPGEAGNAAFLLHMAGNLLSRWTDFENEADFGTVLLELAKKGVSREEAYEWVQRNAMRVWRGEGAFLDFLKADPEVTLSGHRLVWTDPAPVDATIAGDSIHMPVASSDASTTPAWAATSPRLP